jgi:hypothetical protein
MLDLHQKHFIAWTRCSVEAIKCRSYNILISSVAMLRYVQGFRAATYAIVNLTVPLTCVAQYIKLL